MHYEKKLIEGNFPCQEVGAETRRERDTGMAPPTHRLHVWWARRPLTPSRAAILGSILSADTDPNVFLKDLGIVKKQAIIGDNRWTLVGKNIEFIEKDGEKEYIPFNEKTRKALDKENIRREKIMNKLTALSNADSTLNDNQVFTDWKKSNTPLIYDLLHQEYPVEIIPANPSEINQRIDLASSDTTKLILGDKIKIDPEDLYAYSRAYSNPIQDSFEDVTVLDPTSGGGSIPFEAIRLGCNVIANDLNPVATGIEMATLSYPVTFGIDW